MKIELAMLHDLVRACEKAGYVVMAETDMLYNYPDEDSVWMELHGVSRRSGSTDSLCLSARRPGFKGFHPIAIAHFTGEIGIEKKR